MKKMSCRYDKGTTLIEALVYSVIFGLVLTCIYWVLIASMRYYNVANDSIELQQNALISMSTLTQDLCESQTDSVIYNTGDPTWIIFASPRDSNNQYSYDAQMNLYWNKWVCYYIGSNKGVSYLYKKELAINPAQTTPAPVTSHDTGAEFASDSTLPPRTVGKNISSIVVSSQSVDVITTMATFEKSPSTDKQNVLEIRNETKLRN